MDDKLKTGGGAIPISGSTTLLEEMNIFKEMQDHTHTGVKKAIHSELWHACAGPLVSLPQVGTLVYYFPQGHSEQVAVSTKRSATSQIPNYPNLPSQLLCQVHNVTLHVDKDTDEMFAQMSLQSVNSEKDIFHNPPEFGLKPSRHPTDFFCKTLTASDTSTHGGFSVPRRAAEKLFPLLDYTMQPPTQELVVRDLHDNTWTFRHIYRGQPKRHLLTTGWSVFVGSKRLRAGDCVLFIRDEKSQLMIGVRRANRQQTTLPSSVLSADSMHIGVLAAAAHAAANRSPFTVFYNPRACPSDFVIPVNKFRKAVYGTQISAGMRFGMMFETEESSKRRYMGSIVGVSDLDPLRWPGSKWRCLQVEWDEPGCGDKQNRVSPWEIETHESLFLFPSLTSGFKRPGFLGGELDYGNLMKRPLVQAPETGLGNLQYTSIPGLHSEDLIKMLLRPHAMNYPSMQGSFPSTVMLEGRRPKLQTPTVTPTVTENTSSAHLKHLHPPALRSLGVEDPQVNSIAIQDQTVIDVEKIDNVEPVVAAEPEKTAQLGSMGQCIEDKNTVSNAPLISMNPTVMPPQDPGNLNGLIPYTDVPDWLPNVMDSGLPSSMGQELWSQHWTSVGASQQQFDPHYVQCDANTDALLDASAHTQSGVYSCLEYDGAANGGSTMIDPSSVSNCVMDEFPAMKDAAFQFSSDCLVGNFSSSQDLQSQITSASLADSRAFSIQDFPDNSGGTSTNAELDETSLLQNSSSWQQVNPPLRSYTKVQKAGSVGRSIDVTSFKNYNELRAAIQRMFGLDGLLSDPRGSGWQLVYVDFENDVLLVGDDPWEEFVSCVRCIRILSPPEVQQMSEEGEGMQLPNANTSQ